jgi:hypothetical protein
MKSLSYSLLALMMSTGLAAAQAPMQSPGPGAEPGGPGGGGGRQQERALERSERREQRMERREERMETQGERQGQLDRSERREQRMERREQGLETQGERQGQQGARAMRRGEDDGRSGSTIRVERDRGDRFEDRTRERVERRVIVRERDRGPNYIVRDRGPDIRFGVGPTVYIRTLPLQYRTVIYGGRPCRITITRRVRANGRIVTTETRKCPGRPTVVIRRG